jgi:hypothetical protein
VFNLTARPLYTEEETRDRQRILLSEPHSKSGGSEVEHFFMCFTSRNSVFVRCEGNKLYIP